MYALMTPSSRPTVQTKYPRAPKCCPTKLRFLSPYTRAMWIALFPFRKPHNLRHRVLRWNRYEHMHVIWHQMTFLNSAFFSTRKFPEYLT
jgi:hypothetical protein